MVLSPGPVLPRQPAHVFEAAAGGAHLLGVAIANLYSLLDPEIVIVGGGLSRAGDALLGPLSRTAREYVCTFLRDRVRIAPAQLGDEAGLIGAGLSVWEPASPSTTPS